MCTYDSRLSNDESRSYDKGIVVGDDNGGTTADNNGGTTADDGGGIATNDYIPTLEK